METDFQNVEWESIGRKEFLLIEDSVLRGREAGFPPFVERDKMRSSPDAIRVSAFRGAVQLRDSGKLSKYECKYVAIVGDSVVADGDSYRIVLEKAIEVTGRNKSEIAVLFVDEREERKT